MRIYCSHCIREIIKRQTLRSLFYVRDVRVAASQVIAKLQSFVDDVENEEVTTLHVLLAAVDQDTCQVEHFCMCS